MSYKNKLNFPIIISIVFHAILIIVLSYKAWQYHQDSLGDVNGKSIDAIMVDTEVINQQYQRQLQSKISKQNAELQRQKQIEKQSQELQERQLAEQQKLKELEKERLKFVEQQKQEIEAATLAKKQAELEALKAKSELEEQQKKAAIAKQKAELEKLKQENIEKERKQAELEKQKAILEAEVAKKEAEKQKQAAKEAAEQAAKEAAEQAKQKAESIKTEKAVNDILGELTSSKPTTKSKTAATRQGSLNGELDKYKSLVLNAIRNKFINPNKLYNGRTCSLKIQIAPDGLLLDVISTSGDPALCREAIAATKLAIIPKPSDKFYDEVKNMTFDFIPN